jgi:hypothetical protein
MPDVGTSSTSTPDSSEGAVTLDDTGVDPSDDATATVTTSSPTTLDSSDDATSSVSTTGTVCPPDWHDCTFAFRRRLTPMGVDGAVVVDFPVRLGLDGAFDWSHAADDGSDVRFFGDGGTPYPHEIEAWLPENGAEIWLRLPTLGSGADEPLWMYYGSAAPPPALDSADVWSNQYLAVWHMQTGEDSLGSYDLDATNTAVVAGLVGFAQEFDGATTRMTNDLLDDPFAEGAMITAWINPTGWGASSLGRIADMRETTPIGNGWSFQINAQDLPLHALRFTELHGAVQLTATSPADSIALDAWQWVGLSYRHTDPILDPVFYIDGFAVETAIPTTSDLPAAASSAPFTIGALAGGDARFFLGLIDEFRIATEIRDDNWVAYEYASVAWQLVDLGAEEAW